MQEDFLHYLWKFKKFEFLNLKTSNNEVIIIKSTGTHNHNSGPDFFNAKLEIDGQIWAGNVEIHLKSSDWFVHNHETDTAYDNVILHVVWEDDVEVFRKDQSKIPTVELKNYVDNKLLKSYQKLFSNQQKWINCENDFKGVDDFIITNWLERLYFERLEQKSQQITLLLEQSKNDWEAVLFKMLAKNFGLKVNGDGFLSLANSIDFSIIRKLQSNNLHLEALLFGQANFLAEEIEEAYYKNLQEEYIFLKQKFQLQNQGVLPIQFFRLRPANFPTIRLSQLASIYSKHQNVFSKIIDANRKEDFYDLFNVETSEFWKSHYTFTKTAKSSPKKISKAFVDLLLINTIILVKFAYAKQSGKDINEEIQNLIQTIKSEKNSIVSKFQSLKPVAKTALDSQALIQLKNTYCDKNKCLDCAVGSSLLTNK